MINNTQRLNDLLDQTKYQWMMNLEAFSFKIHSLSLFFFFFAFFHLLLRNDPNHGGTNKIEDFVNGRFGETR
jgi:hypothetical protein